METPRRETFSEYVLDEDKRHNESPSLADIQLRLDDIRERIDRRAKVEMVRIVLVTKGFPVSTLMVAKGLGLRDFGENYFQEFSQKARLIPDISWHFIGRLQRNKISHISLLASAIHSVGREVELSDLAHKNFQGEVFLQVRSDDLQERNGFDPAVVGGMIRIGRDLGLNICGLMGVASISGGHSAPEFFRLLGKLRDTYGLERLSMGMSSDFELALDYGATDLRLGKAILGPRPN